MNNWARLFAVPRGRIGRRTFWHGVIVVTLANVSLISLAMVVPGRFGYDVLTWAALAPLATLYPTICIYTKRLHDLGYSGWLQAPPRLLWVIALLSHGSLGWWAGMGEAGGWVLVVALPIAALTDGLLLAWLGLREGPSNPLEAFD